VPGAVIFGGIAAAMIYGYYQMHNTNMHQRELKQEERAVRLNLVPFLQAESDARYVRDRAMYAEWEANVMKDVPGWEVQKAVLHNTSVWLDNAPTVP
jgi:NADH dehydrogenase (ubiquinone) 1 alpha subcomplex subunit 13